MPCERYCVFFRISSAEPWLKLTALRWSRWRSCMLCWLSASTDTETPPTRRSSSRYDRHTDTDRLSSWRVINTVWHHRVAHQLSKPSQNALRTRTHMLSRCFLTCFFKQSCIASCSTTVCRRHERQQNFTQVTSTRFNFKTGFNHNLSKVWLHLIRYSKVLVQLNFRHHLTSLAFFW